MSGRRRSRRSQRALGRIDGRHGRLLSLVIATVAVVVVVVVVSASRGRPESTTGAALVGTAAVPTAGVPVAVIGDSISAGTPYGGLGAANWSRLVASHEHWTLTNTAIGGTGYVNAGSSGPFEAAQAPQAIAASPRLVIVQGSRNDVGLPLDQIASAAAQLYRHLRTALPDAHIVVVGPFWDAGSSRKALVVRDTLATAARNAGASFVDPMREGWFTDAYGGPLIGADGVHPTDAGHALYAERLEAALHRLGVEGA